MAIETLVAATTNPAKVEALRRQLTGTAAVAPPPCDISNEQYTEVEATETFDGITKPMTGPERSRFWHSPRS
jgi:non-canonical (house-cleaning) NTP pyrophosphatase